MDDMPEQDRAALVALLDQALRDETRTEPPLEAEQGEWLYADTELSQPDENGWMTRVPRVRHRGGVSLSDPQLASEKGA